jgi:hypothetical protein
VSLSDDLYSVLDRHRRHEEYRRITGWLQMPPDEATVARRIQECAALPSLLEAVAEAIDFTGPAAAKAQIKALAHRLRCEFPVKEILP